jgi:hypothetical protein
VGVVGRTIAGSYEGMKELAKYVGALESVLEPLRFYENI